VRLAAFNVNYNLRDLAVVQQRQAGKVFSNDMKLTLAARDLEASQDIFITRNSTRS